MGSPWTDLAAVIAAAAPGDIVLLNGMTFPPIVMNKGLTILGPGSIAAGVGTALQSTLTIPAGERAHLSDVGFVPYGIPGFGLLGGHKVVANGRVTFEHCFFHQGVPNNLVVSGDILLNRCSVLGDASSFAQQTVGGMVVQSGYCSLVDCTIRGGNAVFCGGCPSYWIPATVALQVNGGTVAASNTVFIGGSGGLGGVFVSALGSSAVQAAGTSYFADCTLTAGANPAGAPLPHLVGGATTFYARTMFGTTTGPQSNARQLVGLQMSQSLRLGQTSVLTAIAGTGTLLGILAGFDGVVGTHPIVVEPVLAPVTNLVTLTLANPVPGSAVTHALLVPSAPALVGVALFAQAFQLDGVVLRASAAVGSVVR